MGPKKGKAGKEPKLDEAQLAELRLQQQNVARAELKARLEEEAKISKINSLKITNQWRKIMRLAKTEALKKDIEILSQNHERDVDRKDAILQMLDRDLEEAEDQYQMSLRSHLMNIDELIKLHDSRLYALERSFHQDLKTLQGDFNAEKDIITGKFQNEKKELNAIIDSIEAQEEARDNDAKHLFEQLREEIRNKNLEEINMLRISLDAQIEELEQHFETAHLNYLQQTAQRTHDFKELTQNDQRLSLEIEQKRKKIDNLQTTIQHWRAKMRQLNRETEERNRLLLAEKHSIQKHYQQLKQRIKVYRSTQNTRLLHLSQSANLCKKALSDKIEFARRIIQLSELSRKMESIHEQVLPFVPPDVDTGEQLGSSQKANNQDNGAAQDDTVLENDTNTHGKVPPITQPVPPAMHPSANIAGMPYGPPAHQSSVWTLDEIQPVPDNERLANFYRKYNKVMLDNVAINKEKDRLELENAQLQDLIQQYMSGMQLDTMTLADDNPLFVVNGRANLNHAPPVRKVKIVSQEANNIISTTQRQIAR